VVITRLVTALRASEDRWRNVFENNPTMYFMVDAGGTVLSVNLFGASQLGYEVDELVGRPVLDVFLEEDKAAARDHVARCLAHPGQSLSWELRKVRKDGSMLWGRETARAVQRGGEGAVVLVACEDVTSEKATREQLRRSEARLRGQANLLDLTHDAIFVRDLNSVIVYWNRGAEEFYGWRKDEALGRVTHELLRTEFPEPIEQIMATLLRTGRWDGELAHTRRDGTRIVVASRWSLQPDEAGNPARVLETNNNITERERAAEALRRSEAYLAEAQRLTHTGSFALDPATRLHTFMSEELFRICGLDPRAGISSPQALTQFVHPDDRDPLVELMRKAIREGEVIEAEYRLLEPDGALKHLQLIAHPVLDAAGALAEYVGTVVDVTERKRAEEERRLVLRDLRESARRYRNIFQTAAVSIWEEDFSAVRASLDELRAGGVRDFQRYFAEHPEFVVATVPKVRVIDVNDATLRLFGAASRDELLVSLGTVFTPETLAVFAGELLALAEGRTSFAAETVLQTVRGERLDVLFTLAFPPEPASLDSVLVSIMDVTARKRAEEALREAQVELSRASTLTTMGQLAGSIAHELRQPLAAMAMDGSATLRWLNREVPDLGEAREAAARVVKAAHRADDVIRGLRALVGMAEPRHEPFDVNDAVHEVLALVRGELRRTEVSVHPDLDQTLPPALGDRVQVQQVVLNLVMNAIEAMAPVEDRVRALVIRTGFSERGEAAVTVADTGPGLDPATEARIFDAFFTTKPNGLGMGLSICRSIVEAHGGRLSAAPHAPRGSAFRFTVPTVATAKSTSPPTGIPQAAGDHAAQGLTTT
ncbi:MAG: PAS domain S-box protein, partial [Gemmatimonadaceae bacterium]